MLTKGNLCCWGRADGPEAAEEEPGGGVRMKPGNSSIKIYESAKKLLFLKAIILVKYPSIYIYILLLLFK